MREYCKSLGLQHAILGDEDMKTHIIMVYNALLTCHSLQTLACCVPLAVFEEEIATTFYLAGTEGLEPGPILATLKQLRLQHLSFAQVTRAPPVDGLAALQEWFDSRSEQNKIVLKDSACKATSAKSRPAEVAGRWRRAMFVETKVAIKLVERSADGEEVKGEFDLVADASRYFAIDQDSKVEILCAKGHLRCTTSASQYMHIFVPDDSKKPTLKSVKLMTRAPLTPPETMEQVASLDAYADLSSTLASCYDSSFADDRGVLYMVMYQAEDGRILTGQELCNAMVHEMGPQIVKLSQHKPSIALREMAWSDPERFFLKDMALTSAFLSKLPEEERVKYLHTADSIRRLHRIQMALEGYFGDKTKAFTTAQTVEVARLAVMQTLASHEQPDFDKWARLTKAVFMDSVKPQLAKYTEQRQDRSHGQYVLAKAAVKDKVQKNLGQVLFAAADTLPSDSAMAATEPTACSAPVEATAAVAQQETARIAVPAPGTQDDDHDDDNDDNDGEDEDDDDNDDNDDINGFTQESATVHKAHTVSSFSAKPKAKAGNSSWRRPLKTLLKLISGRKVSGRKLVSEKGHGPPAENQDQAQLADVVKTPAAARTRGDAKRQLPRTATPMLGSQQRAKLQKAARERRK
eukprot:m.27870 g.27870  ORF g.27870 m.27870 type:complete len:634 (-) comp11781_c0_seq4:131-2032(-)